MKEQIIIRRMLIFILSAPPSRKYIIGGSDLINNLPEAVLEAAAPAVPAVFFLHLHFAAQAAAVDLGSSQRKENSEEVDAFVGDQEEEEEAVRRGLETLSPTRNH